MDKEIKERRECLRKILAESFIKGMLAALKNGHYWESMGGDHLTETCTEPGP